jgi:hypothetical protein
MILLAAFCASRTSLLPSFGIFTYTFDNNDNLTFQPPFSSVVFVRANPGFYLGSIFAQVGDTTMPLPSGSRFLFNDDPSLALQCRHAYATCTVTAWWIPPQCGNRSIESSNARSAKIDIRGGHVSDPICYFFSFKASVTFSMDVFGVPSQSVWIMTMIDGELAQLRDLNQTETFRLGRQFIVMLRSAGDMRIDITSDALAGDWSDSDGQFVDCRNFSECRQPDPMDFYLTVDRGISGKVIAVAVAAWAAGGIAIVVLMFGGTRKRLSFKDGMKPLMSTAEVTFT